MEGKDSTNRHQTPKPMVMTRSEKVKALMAAKKFQVRMVA